MKNFNNVTIDLIKNQNCSLDSSTTYYVHIADSCVIDNILKVCVEFRGDEPFERHHLLLTMEIGGEDYMEFIENIYIPDGDDVIAVNLYDFTCFSAKCPGYAVQEGRIKWEMLELCETPLQSLSPERW